MKDLPELGVDAAARAAGADPDVLRLENLDTDVPPPAAVLEATRASVGVDAANSYLPFNGLAELREAVAERLLRQTGVAYDAEQDVVITCGGTEGLFDALLATVQEGDEVDRHRPHLRRHGQPRADGRRGARLRALPASRRRLAARPRRARGRRERAHPRAVRDEPSMPSGAVLDAAEWEAIGALCRRRGCWLIYNAAMERIVFDGRPVVQPAGLDGLADHVITVGSVSKEWRMIGWRVGWVAGPRSVMGDVTRAHLFNVVTPVSLTQAAAVVALRTPDDDAAAAVAEWQRRRDVVVAELAGYDVVPGRRRLVAARRRLPPRAQRSRGGAAPARARARGRHRDGRLGPGNGPQHVRIVFANEPVRRLAGLGERFAAALG